MSVILVIGLTLFLCSVAAIWVTLRASADADRWRYAVRKRSRFQEKNKTAEGKPSKRSPLADRKRLAENARKLEGTTFLF
ncbi:MAG: hypothetical protein GY899_15090 [Verrucomicrobiaceae bacterium]|nr:hypothetical protein [Verrucomicrobiaceae bacterium]